MLKGTDVDGSDRRAWIVNRRADPQEAAGRGGFIGE